ncbi:MAG: DNA repair protein RecN, partial [Bacteroidales bacterium]|nr:DNA repair protein RecN [Bacteroidales bacterium]
RLNVLNHLCTKHRVSSDKELIEIKNQVDEKLQHLSSSSNRLEACSLELEKCEKELRNIADKLSQSRIKVINTVCEKISLAAKDLGMPDAKLEFNHTLLPEFSIHGIDSVELMFTANKGIALRPLEKIASGGELSRIMLAVKSIISERSLIPIIIFDEIDTGVSGDIASKVAVIMKKMAHSMQVIAITHLPQIAAKAKTHYWVYKKKTDDITESEIKILNSEERIIEIAKMISNDTVTEVSMMAAKELLS